MVLMPVYIRIFLMITHGFHWTSKHSFVESSVSNFRLESQLKSTLLLFYSSYWENSIEILHRRFIWLFLINCYTIHFVFIQSGLKRLFACISRNFPAFYQVFNWIEKKKTMVEWRYLVIFSVRLIDYLVLLNYHDLMHSTIFCPPIDLSMQLLAAIVIKKNPKIKYHVTNIHCSAERSLN